MPLQDHLPVIDDRRFHDLVDEVRNRIPRYTPEWTDSNASDPGFTLIQLFAWLTEMQLYRLSRVPELNYIKFLELIGIELQPAQPARAEVTFPVRSGFPEPYVTVPARTQIGTEAPDAEGPILFETERALTALAARLDAVQTYDGYAYTDLSEENREAREGFLPFGGEPDIGKALLLGFDHEALFPAVSFDLTVWAAEEASEGRSCDLTTSARGGLDWECWGAAGWRPLDLLQDGTAGLTRSGAVGLRVSAQQTLVATVIGRVEEPRYWIRARLSRSPAGSAPRLLAVRTNTVAAVQAETTRLEVLGGSNGRPHQTFRLANTPLLAGSLSLEVDEGSGAQPWLEVPDFFASTPQDPHYTLNRTTGEVRFGDGEHGRIPTGNLDNPRNIVAREYRSGGGKRGNLAPGMLSVLLTPVPGVDSNAVGNLMVTRGGQDEETLQAAKRRAPHLLKGRDRAVTPEDFEGLALQVANVRRAKALPRYHPDFPGTDVPGAVTVVVVPEDDTPNPVPDAGTLRDVCAYLNARRLLTTELYVVGPRYREVEVRAEVVVEDTADPGRVRQSLEDSLGRYLHPLRGGEDGEGWPFGRDIHFSLIFHRIQGTAGVRRIRRLTLVVDGEELPECTDVTVETGVLVYSGQHRVTTEYEYDE